MTAPRPSRIVLRDSSRPLAALTLVLAAQACAHRPPPAASLAPATPAAEGRVGFGLVRDPNSPRPRITPGQEFTPPATLRTVLPEYPRQALVGGAAPVILIVRVIIEEDGTVREVHPSPLDRPAGSGDPEPFRAAVEEAARRWEFAPATIRTFAGRDIEGDGTVDYQVLEEAHPVRTYLDLRFTFEVVGGQGRVQFGSDH